MAGCDGMTLFVLVVLLKRHDAAADDEDADKCGRPADNREL